MPAFKFVLTLSLSLLLCACFDQDIKQIVVVPTPNPSVSPSQNPDESAIIQVIQDNANFLNTESLEQYQQTFHANSELMAGMPDLFYRLRGIKTFYNVLSVKVQSLSKDSASVDVKRKTTDYSGTVDQAILYTLRKDTQGHWKIYSMVKQEESRVW